MDFVAYLPPPLLAHLRITVGREHGLVAVAGWDELDSVLRRRLVDAAVLDPQLDPEGSGGIEKVRERFPSVPVVVYTVLAPGSLRVVVELAQRGIEHVVLHRFDDDPRRFRELLERLPGYELSQLVLERLSEPLKRVPVGTARAIDRLFRSPNRFLTAVDLAAAAGVPVRRLYRQLDRAGFASPRVIVQGARLLRAYAYLRDPGCLLEDAAAKLGYRAPRVLSRQIREATGLLGAEWRYRMTADELVQLLARRMYPGMRQSAHR